MHGVDSPLPAPYYHHRVAMPMSHRGYIVGAWRLVTSTRIAFLRAWSIKERKIVEVLTEIFPSQHPSPVHPRLNKPRDPQGISSGRVPSIFGNSRGCAHLLNRRYKTVERTLLQFSLALPHPSPALNPGSCFGLYDFLHDFRSATTWTMAANRKSHP